MTLHKRGLGRGLEALLADDSTKVDINLSAKQIDMPLPTMSKFDDGKAAMLVTLIKNIQKEHLTLLEEAESLKKLIEEFESIVRDDVL